jgi:hypothetical protein
MLFQRKHLLVALQMEARRLVEVTNVLGGDDAERAGNMELGSGAQMAGVGAAQAAERAEGSWVACGGHC